MSLIDKMSADDTMTLNWDAFLTDDSIALSNDQWFEPSQTTAGRSSNMPKSSSTRTTGSQPDDFASFESLLSDFTREPYFDDSLMNNDYFVGDLDVLQPFSNPLGGDDTTSDSSPEPVSGISSVGSNPFQTETGLSITSQKPMPTSTVLGESRQMPSMSRGLQRLQTIPKQSYESMFPNNFNAGIIEDVTFPDGPTGHSNAMKASSNDKKRPTTTTQVKRGKADSKPDILTACWTSPLCPNHDQDGPPPNPSTCGGGCAPFLFAKEEALPPLTAESSSIDPSQEVVIDEGLVEIKRPKKRSDSDSASEKTTGRQFPSRHGEEVQEQAAKSESPRESTETAPEEPDDEGRAKSRRRLPHNQVERKYRESLNTQLESLRRVVPSLQQNRASCEDADIEDLPAPSKPSKAVILASATSYIKHMEKEKKQMQDENLTLKKRVQALQALVKCEDCSLMQYVMDLKINQAR